MSAPEKCGACAAPFVLADVPGVELWDPTCDCVSCQECGGLFRAYDDEGPSVAATDELASKHDPDDLGMCEACWRATLKLSGVRAKLPVVLWRALSRIDPPTAFVLASQFLASNEEDQAGMLDFVTGEGPRRIGELETKRKDGTPTAADLASWLAR